MKKSSKRSCETTKDLYDSDNYPDHSSYSFGRRVLFYDADKRHHPEIQVLRTVTVRIRRARHQVVTLWNIRVRHIKYNDHLSNYLFLGIDTRESVDTYQSTGRCRTGQMRFLVVSMDRATEKIKVLFVPRDSMTEIEVFNPSGKSLGMTTDHINIQYAFGDGRQKSCELMKTAVSNLLEGLPIQGYCSMNMDGNSGDHGLRRRSSDHSA